MYRTLFDKLLDLTLSLVLWVLPWLTPFLRSKTGHANPRVRHITGTLGYQIHSHQLALSNYRTWDNGQGELFPNILQVQTVNRCNAACPMCPYPYTTHLQPREVMEAELFDKIATECASEPSFHILVPMSKNEPLLDPHLEARVAAFKALAAPHQMVEVVTNGSALTPTRFARLVASGVDLLAISVNAASKAVYEEVMTGLAWAQVQQYLAHIAQADNAQVNIYVRYVQQRANLAETAAFVRQWHKQGFNVLVYEINNRSGSLQGYAQLAAVRGFFLSRLRKAMGRQMFGLCPYAFSLMHVLQNGDVPLCANDWHNREVLGNVRHQTLREIYNAPRLREIRALMQQGRYAEIAPCRDCSFWREWFTRED